MKVDCVKERLAIALTKAERAIGKNPTLPVLNCVLIEAKNGNLTLRSTNLDISLKIVVPAKVSSSGQVAVPGHLISQFVNNLYDDRSLILETKEQNLVVSTSHSQTCIKSFNADDFPSIPDILGTTTFLLEARGFIDGLKSVWFSASTSSIKPELSSVYIYADGNNLVFVATDSFRLAEKKLAVKKLPELTPILLPIKSVAEIIKIFDGETDDLEISCAKNQISISSNQTYLVSRVIDGSFPDYRQIIPKEFKTEAIVLKQEFVSALKLTNTFSDKFNQIKVSLEPKQKLLSVATKNQEVGEQETTLDAAISGEPVVANFNHRYLGDCLPSINSDSLSLCFSNPSTPLIIAGISDRSFSYLVMPMNK
jgi:DNA polymerase-3 subunit beta